MAEDGDQRNRRDYSDTLTVLVGPDEKHFTIHKQIACAKSTYFEAACKPESGWMEGREKFTRLPEQDPEAFEVFVHWIYTEKIDFANMTEVPNAVRPSYRNLGKIWALAHYLQSSKLQDQLINLIINKLERSQAAIAPTTLQYIWEITPPNSALRRLLIDVSVRRKRRETMESLAILPEEIVHGAAHRHFTRRTSPEPFLPLQDRCPYHEHAEVDTTCLYYVPSSRKRERRLRAILSKYSPKRLLKRRLRDGE